jgi:hypothetical protein
LKDVPTDGHSAATLIGMSFTVMCSAGLTLSRTATVVPLSIISNWEKQIQDHCTPGTIKSIVYYGDNRGLTVSDLEGYDVVITTYQTVAGEHANHTGLSSGKGAPSKKKQKHENSLMTMKWKVCNLRVDSCVPRLNAISVSFSTKVTISVMNAQRWLRPCSRWSHSVDGY